MTKITLLVALVLGFSLAGCTIRDVQNTGGSGLDDPAFGTSNWVGSRVGIGDCLPDDINCRIIYNGPGGD